MPARKSTRLFWIIRNLKLSTKQWWHLAKWRKHSTAFLKTITTANHPKAIIQNISDDLLSVYADYIWSINTTLSDLMNYWEESDLDMRILLRLTAGKPGRKWCVSPTRRKKKTEPRKREKSPPLRAGRPVDSNSLAIKTYLPESKPKLMD